MFCVQQYLNKQQHERLNVHIYFFLVLHESDSSYYFYGWATTTQLLKIHDLHAVSPLRL